MAKIQQGEIWWANLAIPARRRPVLILTRTDAVDHMHNVTVAPLTRTIRHIDSEVILSPKHGVPSLCAISLDNVMTIPKKLLDGRIVTLDHETMAKVFEAVRFVFAMT